MWVNEQVQGKSQSGARAAWAAVHRALPGDLCSRAQRRHLGKDFPTRGLVTYALICQCHKFIGDRARTGTPTYMGRQHPHKQSPVLLQDAPRWHDSVWRPLLRTEGISFWGGSLCTLLTCKGLWTVKGKTQKVNKSYISQLPGTHTLLVLHPNPSRKIRTQIIIYFYHRGNPIWALRIFYAKQVTTVRTSQLK